MLHTISKEPLFHYRACMLVTQIHNSTTYNNLCIFAKYVSIATRIQKWPKTILGRDGEGSPLGICNMDHFLGSLLHACKSARQRQYWLLSFQEVKWCKWMVPHGWTLQTSLRWLRPPSYYSPQKSAGVVQEEGKAMQTFAIDCFYAVTPFWTGEGLLSIGISVLGQLASVSESSSSKTKVTGWPQIPILAACSWKIFLYHIYLYSHNQPQ